MPILLGYGCNISKSRRNTKVIDNGGSNGIYYARIIRLPEENIVFYMVTNESSINTNMVLPNITQLFFNGKIEDDGLNKQVKFESEISKAIYEIVLKPSTINLENALYNAKIKVSDDMILWEVGQALMSESNIKRRYAL